MTVRGEASLRRHRFERIVQYILMSAYVRRWHVRDRRHTRPAERGAPFSRTVRIATNAYVGTHIAETRPGSRNSPISRVFAHLRCRCESLVFAIHKGYTLPPFDRWCLSSRRWRFNMCKIRHFAPTPSLLREAARGCSGSRPDQPKLHQTVFHRVPPRRDHSSDRRDANIAGENEMTVERWVLFP